MRALILSALLACAYAQQHYMYGQQQQQQEDYDDQQQVQQYQQSVKGYGNGNWETVDRTSGNLIRVNGSRYPYGFNSDNMRKNLTGPQPNLEVGVCYREVETRTLVRGDNPVPTGNGSLPTLSRIRVCCKGYIRNIYNFRKCDPVCTAECVNALCTAPEVCTCFPDHVKNMAGFCVPTCPIGCQNGYCAGGECLCKEGYTLHRDSKFCVPLCQRNCGGIGNCTAPNTCACNSGYHSSPDGSCKPTCDNGCVNGECVSPNVCHCHQGFAKDMKGVCVALCGPGYQYTPQGCKPVCNNCTNGDCVEPNECKCHQGYSKDQQGKCVQQCNPGYQMTPEGCIPLCGSCSYGDCVGPNECRCKPGYGKDQMGHCVPQCNPACPLSSRCVSPNVCFPPDDQSVLPVVPAVPSGVPQCSQPCLNGVCLGDNQCRCNVGYVRDEFDNFKCVPHCPGGCPNGVCSSPNFCICNVGYVKDRSVKGRSPCVKRQKRSVDIQDEAPKNVAEFLVFEIPEY